ncbi:hypothetical protein RIF29_35277 [Crotalaria pallida]|uniref:F-box associated domain-containing protein n=1 Tax=Crotalaria pallida TaxID=3830 RepID=A0AAN9EA68_CROPI
MQSLANLCRLLGAAAAELGQFVHCFVHSAGDAQFVGGAMNWLAKSDGDRDAVIASLDLRTETYKQLVLPPGEEEGPPPKCRLYGPGPLGVLRDSLCYFHDYAKTHFVIWQMKEFGDEKSWTRLVKIQIGGGIGTLFPLCMSENGDVVMLANHKYREAIRYNKSDNTIKRTRIPNRCLDAKDYVRSLALPR